MSFGTRILRAVVGAGVLVVSTAGCTAVVFQEPAKTAKAPAVERDALLRAASEVSRTHWPKPQGASLTRMLSGVVVGSGDRVSEGDAVARYLETLESAPDRRVAVLADAQRHLAAARALADAAEAVAGGVRPTMSDVSLVEGAIGDLRGVRDVYLASLKRLSKEGELVDGATLSSLRSDFNASIQRLGASADRLTAAGTHHRTQTVAGRTGRRANFTGS